MVEVVVKSCEWCMYKISNTGIILFKKLLVNLSGT